MFVKSAGEAGSSVGGGVGWGAMCGGRRVACASVDGEPGLRSVSLPQRNVM